ncbi:MAG: hypothetical protein U1C96_06215 [Gallionella sp.]|nr:hypothetical protein [Gallionella sp.]
MKIRLGIFALALLLLPLTGTLLGGGEWDELFVSTPATTPGDMPTLLVVLTLAGMLALCNLAVTRRSGNNPLKTQRRYFLAVAAVSAALGWLLAYLNLYVASWETSQGNTFRQLALDTLLFALLAPAVLSLRALLGSFTALLQRLARGPSIPAADATTRALVLMTLSALGLIAGAAWPAPLFWLFWLAPLLLLVALQLMWHESTLFANLKHGDWARVICAALAGLVVGNLAVSGYRFAGGELYFEIPHALFAQLAYALFGLLCVQLGDVVAEQWRGKTRAQLLKKKPFPIPVVTK